MARRKRNFAPDKTICHWCREPAPNTPWRSTMRTMEDEPKSIPPHSGWMICGPDCPEKPEYSQPFMRRPAMAVWLQMGRKEQEAAASQMI